MIAPRSSSTSFSDWTRARACSQRSLVDASAVSLMLLEQRLEAERRPEGEPAQGLLQLVARAGRDRQGIGSGAGCRLRRGVGHLLPLPGGNRRTRLGSANRVRKNVARCAGGGRRVGGFGQALATPSQRPNTQGGRATVASDRRRRVDRRTPRQQAALRARSGTPPGSGPKSRAVHPGGASMSQSPPIIYTLTDEAPALATHSFLPIIQAFAGAGRRRRSRLGTSRSPAASSPPSPSA